MTGQVKGSTPVSVSEGFTGDLSAIARAFGLSQIGDVEYLAAGLMNRNWRIATDRGVFALKQIIDVPLPVARRNLNVLATLAENGVPACVPARTVNGDPVAEVDGRGYCLFPWLEGSQPRGNELPIDQAADLGAVLGRLHQSLNSADDVDLPEKPRKLHAGVTELASAIAEADRFLTHISRMDSSEPFDLTVVEFLERRKILLDKYDAWRPTDDVPLGPFGWTHGDFQHLNVIWRGGRVVGVIDWDRIRVRPFGEEVARSTTLLFGGENGDLDLGRVSAFVAGYRTVVSLGAEDLADAVNRLWWKRMCDYWQLEFHYDLGDHSCDHLFLSASRFLDWWIEHLDEVQDSFAP